jgi:hypothetical protein
VTYTVSKLSESLTTTDFKDAIMRERDISPDNDPNQNVDDDILNIQIRSPKLYDDDIIPLTIVQQDYEDGSVEDQENQEI